MKRTYHVAHFHTSRDWGGGEYQVVNLVQRLVLRGVGTTLFTHPFGKLYDAAQGKSLPVLTMPSAAFFPLIPFSVSSLCECVRGMGVNIIHAHDSIALGIAVAVRKKTGLPVVLSRRVASPLRRNFLSRRKYSRKHLSAVIAISETVKMVLAQSGFPPERIHVAPSGIDIESLAVAESDIEFRKCMGGKYLVGGVGKLSLKKNWQLMIKTAAHLAKTGPDIQWCLAGEGPEDAVLRKLAESLGVADRFHFLGFRGDAVRILKTLDLLFFPSVMEGASVTVRTAMAIGTPVVAVDAAGTMESLAGHGWAVGRYDVEGAARCVVEALTNEQARAAKIKAARESAMQRFSLERTVEGTIGVYEKVLEETGRGKQV